DTGPILESIKEARKQRPANEPIMIHTDRGVHYTCDLYRKLTRGMVRSYSAKGVPYDNACIESFHSLIKMEWLNRFVIQNYRHAYRLVSEYIDGWYNPKRIHSHCGYMPPTEYEVMYPRTSTD
ncbi:integrase core domain-containing protein, partial [Faecalibaculum rodentium]